MKPWRLAFAATFCCLAAHAQEPAGAVLPGVSRDCGVREADLGQRMAGLTRSRDELEQEGASLAREKDEMDAARRRAEAAGPAQVDAYNARHEDFNRRVALHNERTGALNAEVARFNAESDRATADCRHSLRLSGGEEPKLDADERAVLAVLVAERLRGGNGPVMLEDHTATFLCSRSLPDVMQFDGCSGLRTRAESPRDVIGRLKRAWPDVSDAALADLAAKGEVAARIDEPLAIAVHQVLRGYGENAPTERVDASVKVSRVGFDAGRSEAVAYTAVRSKDRARSYAEYAHLARTPAGGWAVIDRVRVR
ncbi:MAG TPA: hypothetical protein VFE23_16195 [Usitatibacter sp.]|jgi:hypothetical protein|nr:hypothetical protein [Usitatibacter sp.]